MAAGQELRILLVGSAGRHSFELRVPAYIPAVLAASLVLMPMGVGAALGAGHGQVLMRHGTLASLAHHDAAAARMRPGRRARYLLRAPSEAPPPPKVETPAAETGPSVEELLARDVATPEHRRGHLRIYSLHHDEQIDVVPFDADGARNEEAFDALSHLFRCRITGHEVPIDEALARLLTRINDLYDRPLHLISGHRVPHTIDTSPTSQHTVGTAADVRVPGVSTQELREVARQLGARGVGLYQHKRFVHIDFRKQRRYFWSDLPEPSPEGADQAAQAEETATAKHPPTPIGHPDVVGEGHARATASQPHARSRDI